MSTLPTTDKPECGLCERVESGIEKIADDLLYSLFNPYNRDQGEFDVTELIKKHISEEMVKDFEMLSSTFKEFTKTFGYISNYWMDKIADLKEAKQKAWEELKEMLRQEMLSREQLSMSQIVDNFFDEVIEELQDLGYIEKVETRFHRKIVSYTAKAEKVLGEKVLSLSLQNLEKKHYGEHETEKIGVSIFSSERLVEFDPYLHTFDNLDIPESLLKSAIRGEIEFEEREMVARQPKHSEKCVYVMLIDVSDSMRGRKIVGAIEAAMCLKRAIKRGGSNDELRVVAFNHRVREIKEGDILNLEPRGRTDIGLALKKARDILRESSGTGIIFLISDGEPTSSFNPYLTPWRCALKEAEKLRNVDARLQVIMFGKEGRFLELCKNIAKLSGKANLFHFSDPLNLKKFVIKRFAR
ncbi:MULTISPECIES: VWA domain-containing protein [unclassified Archaeoglobus]|jgi:Ca-activated chloride channel family protein|uniref:VWA domain-containing protein n=1 Tax=unclassified Archaeoglobus TaxID=2643606 RepID=UPI0025C2B9F4|nr:MULTISPECIES: VWA domain-containing protein [unclassified Archaeoglobus]